MRIPFEKLTKNANITVRKLAEDLTTAGFYNNAHSAEVTIYKHINDKSKFPVSWDMLKWLALYFKVKGRELIEFDDEEKEPTVSDVAPSIRDDAPGLKKN